MVKIKSHHARIIGIFSSKGGVGRTTIVANLGIKLAEILEDDVLAIDGNFNAPALSIHFGHLNPESTLQEALAGRVSSEKIIRKSGSLHLIYGSASFGEVVQRVYMKSFLTPLKDKYDVILLDTTPGMANETISVLKACDEAILVLNPDIASLLGSLKTLRWIKQSNVPVIGIIVNRVMGEDFEPSAEDIEKAFDRPIIGVVPEDRKVRESLSRGTPVIKFDPNSPAAKELGVLAERVKEYITKLNTAFYA